MNDVHDVHKFRIFLGLLVIGVIILASIIALLLYELFAKYGSEIAIILTIIVGVISIAYAIGAVVYRVIDDE